MRSAYHLIAFSRSDAGIVSNLILNLLSTSSSTDWIIIGFLSIASRILFLRVSRIASLSVGLFSMICIALLATSCIRACDSRVIATSSSHVFSRTVLASIFR